ncbi:DUF533 domain-containing protein [Microvirga guangxiensis]|uniref:Uncharacterized protein n=1 Tax=Microvirga guangxiensis TaxID=549386 RepID=A0A1G5LPW9_9HYPH|nr:DUF533 domain-containing protein [Microvirga guangxiensis]SCZ14280.1 Protein of unknown function [Microvirga guangxiensis]
MIDVNKLLNTVLAVTRHHGKATRKSDYRSTAVDARASAISSPAMWAYSETGALAGGLAGTLLTSKHARKLGGSALQIGAVALLGALAYKATATIATASRSFRKTSATRLAAFRRSRPARHNRPRTFALWKGIVAAVALDRAVREAVARCGAAFIETHPTRMQAIKRATRDLVRRFRSRCPACALSRLRRHRARAWATLRMVRRADPGDQGGGLELCGVRPSRRTVGCRTSHSRSWTVQPVQSLISAQDTVLATDLAAEQRQWLP